MSIKRYVANKDNTITNAYKSNLITRGTDANMGASDILEVFSIYAQATTSSLESSRILIDFPISDIISDRNLNKIGQSGSVEFILKLSNAVHGDSTPSNFDLVVSPLSKSWDEGFGLDMEGYTDISPSNWLSASSLVAWNNEGGDVVNLEFKQNFPIGTEDLEVNITELVESWISGSVEKNGVLIKLSGSQENSNQSYYTKKFFARGSEFFFKRPWIEARTSDFLKDNRGNFILSSSLLDSENLNTLVLYNKINGKLKNIPSIGTGSGLFVSLYSGTISPTGLPLALNNNVTKVSASFYKTGIYTASFSVNTDSHYLFDVWFSGSSAENSSSVIFSVGNIIYTKKHDASYDNENTEYIVTIKNIKNSYSNSEHVKFRIFARDKYWEPNIFTVASSEVENIIIEQLYYKIVRVQDSLEVIPYGTGSMQHTRTSYDSEGNYFNFDMSLLEKDYSYQIKLGYIYNEQFFELKESFKFRVD
jgi:hypothetical protein